MLSEEDLEPEFAHSRVYNSHTKRTLARILCSQLELAVTFINVISLVYPAKSSSIFHQVEATGLKDMPARIQRCIDELDRWNDHARDSRLINDRSKESPKSVTLYRNLTRVYYQ